MNKYEMLSPLALAFMGDAVHTEYVRKKVLEGEINKINNYHNQATKYCNAKKQKETLEKIFDTLSEQERDIVRKARNSHPKHSAKNYDEETYNKATSFESLIGFLYLSNQIERMNEILKLSVED